MTPSITSTASSYGSRFLFALIGASLLPSIVCLLNFGMTNGQVYPLAFVFTIISFSAGSHVWMNLAYLASPKWRAYFAKYPMRFYVVPALIMCTSIVAIAQPIKAIGVGYLCAMGFVNIWHHSKQNWGVLSLIGRARGRNVLPLMNPLCRAWIFFAIPLCMSFPAVANWVGQERLYDVALFCAAAFAAYCIFQIWKSKFLTNQDPLVIVAAIALLFYFVPFTFLWNKPWGIIAAGAHSLQYHLIVISSLSLSNRKADKKIWFGAALTIGVMALLTAAAFVTIKTGWQQWDNVWLRVVFGAFLGVNLTHFWVDAFIWKFNNAEVRKLHGEAFNF
ncbi:hypothetical protein E1N52_04320 [Paraburkholderia guartelaensis]|uniref:Uncharacterized protein n=1 Tax=Paraburkholderia guartelaensis TaxID=2546446 RepID=A0A4R5LLD2_9BURK|nr:hypothetical protein [Paraburkholderia guartelaensis]TDG10574.1 hypothetical protein E1N52_04320 [Paraburkholderia guartelaensis]